METPVIVAQHLIARGPGDSDIVASDEDRFALIEFIAKAFGTALLAYCVMRNHLHTVVEGAAAWSLEAFRAALDGYSRAFAKRLGMSPSRTVFACPFEPIAKTDARALATAIEYVHRNPTRVKGLAIARVVDYPWSSAADFAGLTMAGPASFRRAFELVGYESRKITTVAPPLADAGRVVVPSMTPGLILAAASRVYCARPADVVSRQCAPRLVEARALVIALARAEGYPVRIAAGLLRRTPRRTCDAAKAHPVPDRALRLARTLARDDAIARNLPRLAPPPVGHRLAPPLAAPASAPVVDAAASIR